MDTAKVFWSGRSQAVRLPTDYRFESDEVRIRRHGSAVILEPIATTSWSWLDALTGQLDDDFVKAATEPAPEQARNEAAGVDKVAPPHPSKENR